MITTPSLVARARRALVRFGRRHARLLLSGAVLVLLVSCEAGGPLFPDTGSLQVSVQGGAQPPQGYTVAVGSRTRSIGQVPGSTTFDDLASGQHQVQLSGFASGCSALSNPRTVTVPGGGTATTTFVVAC